MKNKLNRKKSNQNMDKHVKPTTATELPLQGFFIFLLGILLIIMVFPRGSFFPRDKMMFTILILFTGILCFAIASLYRQRINVQNTYFVYPLFLFAAYWIPVITMQWVLLWEALAMILYYMTAITVFLVIQYLNQRESYTDTLLHLMLLAGIAAGITSLLGAAGLWDYQNLIMGNRLAGTFQYPNTLAAWMMTLYFIASGFMLEEENTWKKLVYGSIGFFMLFIFVFTYSRAAWMLFPLVALAYLVVIPGKNRLFMILTYVLTGIPLLLALMPFYNATTGDEAGGMAVLLIIMAATAGFALLQAGLLKSFNRLEGKGGKIIYGVLGSLLVGASIFLFMALQTTEPLVFDNMEQEENRNQTLTRNVPDILPATEYMLEMELTAAGGDEEQWPWLVRVDSRDGEGSLTNIFQHIAEPEESGTIELPFETPEETESLRIIFRNHFPETAVTFSEATIWNLDASEEIAYEIPLRYKYLPEALVQRLESIDREQRSADTRVAYYRDSMTILRDNPLGAGGGAWDQLHTEYQSQPYFSRQTHNFFLQTAVEAGLFGLFILIGMTGLILLGLFQVFRKKDMKQISLHIAGLALLAHSFLDFNFTYLSTFILFWAMLALMHSPEIKALDGFQKKLQNITIPGWLLILLLIPVLIVSAFSWNAFRNQDIAAIHMQTGDNQSVLAYMERAASGDPLRPDYRQDLIRNYLAIYDHTNDHTYLEMAQEHFDQIIRYAPRHRELLELGAELHLRTGNVEMNMELLRQRIHEAPLNREAYEDTSDRYVRLAESLMKKENNDEVLRITQEGLDLLELLNNANESAVVPLSVSGTLRNNLMTLRAFREAAHESFPFALYTAENFLYTRFLDLEHATGQTGAWRTWGREDASLETELTAEGLVTTNTGTDLGLAYTPNLEMEPETEYQVWVDFAEISLENPLRIHVIATDSEDNRTQHSHTHDPAEDGLQASFTFRTTEDIEPGSQYIRFDHPGNDDGSFTIRGIIVTQNVGKGTE